MRGKPCSSKQKRQHGRITPADAGKTRSSDSGSACAWDHPRGCGENYCSGRGFGCYLGSPPRMRGKQKAPKCQCPKPRITPADAGKTVYYDTHTPVQWDHPRGCGENGGKLTPLSSALGSPPRMRGKPIHKIVISLLFRITPADAGKTRRLVPKYPHIQDHPRGCGENTSTNNSPILPQGSPPRMRGKHSVTISPAKATGITPADAGKTNDRR